MTVEWVLTDEGPVSGQSSRVRRRQQWRCAAYRSAM